MFFERREALHFCGAFFVRGPKKILGTGSNFLIFARAEKQNFARHNFETQVAKKIGNRLDVECGPISASSAESQNQSDFRGWYNFRVCVGVCKMELRIVKSANDRLTPFVVRS
jgi:hypothetical protein